MLVRVNTYTTSYTTNSCNTAFNPTSYFIDEYWKSVMRMFNSVYTRPRVQDRHWLYKQHYRRCQQQHERDTNESNLPHFPFTSSSANLYAPIFIFSLSLSLCFRSSFTIELRVLHRTRDDFYQPQTYLSTEWTQKRLIARHNLNGSRCIYFFLEWCDAVASTAYGYSNEEIM